MFLPGVSSHPPADRVLEHSLQIVFTVMTHIPFAYFVVQALKNIVTKGDSTAMMLVIGGFLASAFEPLVDIMGFCSFVREGSWVGFELYGQPIPIWVPATYSWFVGGFTYLAMKNLGREGATRTDVWMMWFKCFVMNLVLEYPALKFGLYSYYGYHPLKVMGFPLWFPACHAITPLIAATIILSINENLKGFKKAVIIPIAVCAYGIANTAFGFPVWYALSLDKSYTVSYTAAAITALLLTSGIWIMSLQIPENGRTHSKMNGYTTNGPTKRH